MGIKVLSLFDGMSCGRLALDKLGVKVDKYYASEIDKYAIKVSSANYPDIIQVGDVCNIKGEDYKGIDLLLAGSPCQGFSSNGLRTAFDHDKSKLFYEFLRILEECNPKYFLLENVKMTNENIKIISLCLGVKPIQIDSSLVTAQNRVRYYWTNIPNIKELVDKGIKFSDITEEDLDKNDVRTVRIIRTKEAKEIRKMYKKLHNKDHTPRRGKNLKALVERTDGKMNCLVTHFEDSHKVKIINKKTKEISYRYPTPTECERLQTVPDGYTSHVSDTQRIKMLGNGWTIDVIANILNGMFI